MEIPLTGIVTLFAFHWLSLIYETTHTNREQNAFVVRGRDSDYFDGWLDTADIEGFISGQAMQYGTDLDVTNYVNKRRITLNPSPSTAPGSKQKKKCASLGVGAEANGGQNAKETGSTEIDAV